MNSYTRLLYNFRTILFTNEVFSGFTLQCDRNIYTGAKLIFKRWYGIEKLAVIHRLNVLICIPLQERSFIKYKNTSIKS